MTVIYKNLMPMYWALVSDGAGAGKSTFLGANAPRPLVAIDTDNRFGYVAQLREGEVILAPALAKVDTIALDDFLLQHAGSETLVVDSMTKLYSLHARRAGMNVRRMNAENTKGNRAAQMLDKADVMAIVRNAASMFNNVFYVWHKTGGINAKGVEEVRDMVSRVELDRLDTSINVWLSFGRDEKGYYIRVDNARDIAGQKANTGFVVYDAPGNYWRGGAERVQRLIYTTFASKSEAVTWAMKELMNVDQVEMEAAYEEIREKTRPENASQMWVSWIQAVDKRTAAKQKENGNAG